ncbi:Hypothetical predicted protein, partial [Marmota monax]
VSKELNFRVRAWVPTPAPLAPSQAGSRPTEIPEQGPPALRSREVRTDSGIEELPKSRTAPAERPRPRPRPPPRITRSSSPRSQPRGPGEIRQLPAARKSNKATKTPQQVPGAGSRSFPFSS